MQHVQVLSVGKAAVCTIKVLYECVATIALCLRRWLTSSLTLLLANVVLSATNRTALLALQVCIAYKGICEIKIKMLVLTVIRRRHHAVHLHELVAQCILEILECQ